MVDLKMIGCYFELRLHLPGKERVERIARSVRSCDDEEIVQYWRTAERRHERDVVRIVAPPKQPHDGKRQAELRDEPPGAEPCLSNVHERIQLAKPQVQDHVRGDEIGALSNRMEINSGVLINVASAFGAEDGSAAARC